MLVVLVFIVVTKDKKEMYSSSQILSTQSQSLLWQAALMLLLFPTLGTFCCLFVKPQLEVLHGMVLGVK